MNHTYKKRLEAGLAALGYTFDPMDRSKYSAWTKPTATGQVKLFVGTAGALRKGECASRSFSVGDPAQQTPIYKHILNTGDKALAVSIVTVNKTDSTFAGF